MTVQCQCGVDCVLYQAQSRCHRIGQNKMVKVYRLITRNSYEREMFDRYCVGCWCDWGAGVTGVPV